MASTSEIQSSASDEMTVAATVSSELEHRDRLAADIDLHELLGNCLGMPTFAVSLLDEFARTARSRIEGFESALKEANLSAISELAHALKGVAGVLAARTLRETTIEIETACQAGDLLQTSQLLDTVRNGIQRILHDIPVISKSLLAGKGQHR